MTAPLSFAPRLAFTLAAPQPTYASPWDLTALTGSTDLDPQLPTGADYIIFPHTTYTVPKFAGNRQIQFGPIASPQGGSVPTLSNAFSGFITYADGLNPLGGVSPAPGNDYTKSLYVSLSQGLAGWGYRLTFPASRAIRRAGVVVSCNGGSIRAKASLADGSAMQAPLALPSGSASFILEYVSTHTGTMTLDLYSSDGQGGIDLGGAYVTAPVNPPKPRGAAALSALLGNRGHGRGSLS